MHSFPFKKSRKLNSFYLDTTININFGNTSTHLSTATTNVNTSIYKDIFFIIFYYILITYTCINIKN